MSIQHYKLNNLALYVFRKLITCKARSNLAQDTEDFNLPLKWRPGTDLMSKMLLCEPKIIDLVYSLVGSADVPDNNYSIAQTEWADGKGVYTLYVSKNSDNDRFFPILIALQEKVNHIAMFETIDRCTMFYEKFRLLPTVLIISIEGCSSLENDEGFNDVDDSFFGVM